MSTTTASLYETDFYGWIQRQAAMLRGRDLGSLDFDNLIEEVESMGRSEKRELASRLELLLMHLLKWQYQPQRRGSSWEATILEQRRKVARHLRENPSLRAVLWSNFRRQSIRDTRLRRFTRIYSKLPANKQWPSPL